MRFTHNRPPREGTGMYPTEPYYKHAIYTPFQGPPDDSAPAPSAPEVTVRLTDLMGRPRVLLDAPIVVGVPDRLKQ